MALLVFYILSQAFDSALRWLLDMAGAAPLIYARDGGVLFASVICIGVIGRQKNDITHTFWILAAFALSIAIAAGFGLGLLQTLFGVKVWLPFLCGFLIFESGLIIRLDRPNFWLLVWFVLCVGIYINYFYRFPWIGLNVEVGDVSISANREWHALGIPRLSGFSRTSYDGAVIILLLFSYLLARLRNVLLRAVTVIGSAAAIALTTSKGVVLAFVVTLLLFPATTLIRRFAPRLELLVPLSVAGVATMGALIPLISLQLPVPRLREGSPEAWIFSSLVARAWDTWPRAIELLSGWEFLSGRGIGGIGAAQALFEPQLSNPADNFFIYLYVTGGAIGIALYVILAAGGLRLRLANEVDRVIVIVLMGIFIYGLTTSLVESGVYALILGAITSALLRPQAESSAVEYIHRSELQLGSR